MKKIIGVLMHALIISTGLMAQGTIRASDRVKVKAALSQHTEYKSFQQELQSLMKTAKGKKTNGVAVISLFKRHKQLLQNLYKRSNINFEQPTTSPVSAVQSHEYFLLKDKKKIAEHPGHGFVPPYTDHWIGAPHASLTTLGDEGSDTAKGKIAFNYYTVPSFYRSIHGSTAGLMYTFRVPDNNSIVAARVEFQYSFYFTGWDTKDADFGLHLYLQCINLASSAFDALPPAHRIGFEPEDKWRNVRLLVPQVVITEEARDFVFTQDSSFVIEGYVRPQQFLKFRIGPGYKSEDHEGINGCYHYGEFILKKIKVSYLKAGD
jgi:hypothetical protein